MGDNTTQAWQEVAHHIDAYIGYPQIQADILEQSIQEIQNEHLRFAGSLTLVKTVEIA